MQGSPSSQHRKGQLARFVFGELIGLEPDLDFGPEDLQANRLGRLSTGQSHRLWALEAVKIVLSVILVAAGLVGLFAGLAGHLSPRGTGGAAVVLILGCLLAFGSLRLWIDLLRGKVKAINGDLQTDHETKGRDIYYYLVIGSHHWEVDDSSFAKLPRGQGTAYQLPFTARLMSLETSGEDGLPG